MAEEFPLQVTLKLLDKATAPLRAFNVKLMQVTAPIKNSATFRSLQSLGKQLAPVGDALSNVGAAIGGVASSIFGLVAKLVGVGVVGSAAFYSVIRSSQEAGDALNDHSKRVGVTADFYASLQYAMKRGGVEVEDFTTAMDKLNKNLGEAKVGKGGGPLVELLNQVSPALSKQFKSAKSSEEAMALLTDAFQRINDPSRRAVLALAAFGKSGVQMGEALHEGSANVQALQAEFLRLAGSQEEFARNSGDLGDAFDSLEVALGGLKNTLAAQFMPAFAELTKALTEFLVEHRGEISAWAKDAAKAIKEWIAGGGLQRLGDTLSKVGSAISAVVKFLGPMGVALAALAVLLAPVVAAFGTLAVSLVSLGVALFPVVTALAGMGIGFGAIATAVAGLTIVVGAFLAMAVSLAYLGKTIYDNWGDLKDLFKNLGETIYYTVDGFKELVGIKDTGTKVLADFLTGGMFGQVDAIAQQFRPGYAAALAPSAIQSAAPSSVSSSVVQSEARVKVDFSGMPQGARVTEAPGSTAPLDMSVGWAVAP